MIIPWKRGPVLLNTSHELLVTWPVEKFFLMSNLDAHNLNWKGLRTPGI
jgi:hypothetical protein